MVLPAHSDNKIGFNCCSVTKLSFSTWLLLQPSDKSVGRKANGSAGCNLHLLHDNLANHASSLVGLTVVSV